MTLGFLGEGEGVELVEVALNFRDAGSGPVGAPEDFVGDFFDARKIFEEFLRGDAGDVHVHIFVAAHEEEGFVHPEGPATVGEDDDQVGVVDADIIAKHGLGVKISGAGKDGSAGVNHDGQVVGLGAIIDGGEASVALQVAIG